MSNSDYLNQQVQIASGEGVLLGTVTRWSETSIWVTFEGTITRRFVQSQDGQFRLHGRSTDERSAALVFQAQTSTTVKFPDVQVQLTGTDGNAFAIIGRVSRALKRAGHPESAVKEFQDEAMSGDYDHLLQTAMKYVDVL